VFLPLTYEIANGWQKTTVRNKKFLDGYGGQFRGSIVANPHFARRPARRPEGDRVSFALTTRVKMGTGPMCPRK
jgi:hypothetical protein